MIIISENKGFHVWSHIMDIYEQKHLYSLWVWKKIIYRQEYSVDISMKYSSVVILFLTKHIQPLSDGFQINCFKFDEVWFLVFWDCAVCIKTTWRHEASTDAVICHIDELDCVTLGSVSVTQAFKKEHLKQI